MAEESAKLLIDVQLVEGAETVKRMDELQKKLDQVKDKSKKAGLQAKDFDKAFSLIGVDSGIGALQSSGQEVEGLISSFKGATKGAKGFKGALKGIKGAIMSTGIGLLVVAIGELVSFLADSINKAKEFEKATYNASASLEEMNENIREGNEIAGMDAEEQIENLKTQLELRQQAEDAAINRTNTLKLAGKTEDQILQIQMDQLRLQLQQRKELIETLRISKKQRVKEQNETFEFVKGFVKFFTAPVKGIALMIASIVDYLSPEKAEGIRMAVGVLDDAVAAMLVDTPKMVSNEMDGLIKEQEQKIRDMENTLAGFTLRQRERARQTALEQNDIEQDALKRQQENQQTILDEIKAGLEAEAKLRQEAYDGELEEFEEFEEEREEIEEKFEMNRRMRRRTRTKDEIEAAQDITEAYAQMVGAVGSGLGALGGLMKENSDAAKILAIAEIAAKTAEGFMNGLVIAQKAASPYGGAAPLAFPIFYAQQIAAVLGAASQAKAILQGGGSSGGGAATAGASSSFTSALIPDGGGELPAPGGIPTGAGAEVEPLQAYVIESDVTSTQALNEELRLRSSL